MKRNREEKRMYAWRRLLRAVDRQIVGAGEGKERARLWARCWADRAELEDRASS